MSCDRDGWCDSGYWKQRAESAEDEVRRLSVLMKEYRAARQLVELLRFVVKEPTDG